MFQCPQPISNPGSSRMKKRVKYRLVKRIENHKYTTEDETGMKLEGVPTILVYPL